MIRRTNYARDIQHGDVHLESGGELPACNGRVIHYSGLAHGLRGGSVEQISLECFARGRAVRVQPGHRRFDSGEVVERALSRLGESHYRILTNNCEHFCAWALRDEWRSRQVERLRALPRALLRELRIRFERFIRHRFHLHMGAES